MKAPKLKKLQELTPKVKTLRDIGTDRFLAKFGDTIANCSYSIARSLVQNHLDAQKVSKKILTNALKNAGMKKYSYNRADAHAMADTAEAFIGYIYIMKSWNIEKIAQILAATLRKFDLTDRKEEIDGSIKSFEVLLKVIKDHLEKEFNPKKENTTIVSEPVETETSEDSEPNEPIEKSESPKNDTDSPEDI